MFGINILTDKELEKMLDKNFYQDCQLFKLYDKELLKVTEERDYYKKRAHTGIVILKDENDVLSVKEMLED